jgi:hypothetical protein
MYAIGAFPVGGEALPEEFERGTTEARVSLNLRVDSGKFAKLEGLRKTGFGFAETERNRSDVYNEILGYGIQLHMLKQELGDREFEKMWRLLHKLNLGRLNFDKIEKMMGDGENE